MASTPLNAPLPRGWRSRLRQWWTNRHVAREHLVLTQRNVYIVPTRVGLLFALTLAVLLVASINYQLNLGHLLTFLLTGSAVVSMYITHATLRGLRLHLSPLPRMYAQHPCELTLRVDAPAGSDRHGLCARLEGATTPTSEGTWFDAPAQAQTEVPLRFVPPARGWHALPVVSVHTRFPFGLFHAWCVWRPAARALVYPQPERPCPPWRHATLQDDPARRPVLVAAGEPDGVRAYRRGDAWHDIVWKKSTTDKLVARERPQPPGGQRVVAWDDTQGLDTESRLSRLTAWVLDADAQGAAYGLKLPGADIAPGQGCDHLAACLEALALWPGGVRHGRGSVNP